MPCAPNCWMPPNSRPRGRVPSTLRTSRSTGPTESEGVRFLFPRTNPITAGDKEVDFILNIRRVKVEEKFHLSDMQYEGKLAL